jgi:hypothetical protein
VAGEIELSAIVVNQSSKKPNQFVPDNIPDEKQWYACARQCPVLLDWSGRR